MEMKTEDFKEKLMGKGGNEELIDIAFINCQGRYESGKKLSGIDQIEINGWINGYIMGKSNMLDMRENNGNE